MSQTKLTGVTIHSASFVQAPTKDGRRRRESVAKETSPNDLLVINGTYQYPASCTDDQCTRQYDATVANTFTNGVSNMTLNLVLDNNETLARQATVSSFSATATGK